MRNYFIADFSSSSICWMWDNQINNMWKEISKTETESLAWKVVLDHRKTSARHIQSGRCHQVCFIREKAESFLPLIHRTLEGALCESIFSHDLIGSITSVLVINLADSRRTGPPTPTTGSLATVVPSIATSTTTRVTAITATGISQLQLKSIHHTHMHKIRKISLMYVRII